MNEPEQSFNRKHLKALFKTLVRAVGKQEAAAEFLGISPQRVSQLANIQNDEMAREIPTWEQVWKLETELGRSVVFAGLAQTIDPPAVSPTACAMKETHDVVQAAAALLPIASAVKAGEPGALEALMEGMERLKQEAVELRAVANVTKMRAVS